MIAEIKYTNEKNGAIKVGHAWATKDDKVCFAKMTIDENIVPAYYIKYSGGNLYNPNFAYGMKEKFKWFRVDLDVFQQYIAFLNTGYERLLRSAERKML